MGENGIFPGIYTSPPSFASSVAPYYPMSCLESALSHFFVGRIRLARIWVVLSVYGHRGA